MKAQKNILSIDLESWVHFYEDATLEHRATSEDKFEMDNGYVPEIANRLLDLLEKNGQRATFFVVSELYDWYPELIERIQDKGHEIAWHTHNHKVLYDKETFVVELEDSRRFLKRFEPIGFRAPQIYFTQDSFNELERFGFQYSSSTYHTNGELFLGAVREFPVSSFKTIFNLKDDINIPKYMSIKLLFQIIPFGSGLFIGLFGRLTSRFVRHANNEGRPAIIFVHPWQFGKHPRISGPRFRLRLLFRNPLCLLYLIDITKTFDRLLQRHSFTSFREYYYG